MMGGRGTFAVGNNVAYTYETVGFIDGVKVLQGISGKHSLPEEAHSSSAYIKLKHDGSFHEIRFYDNDHYLTLEIAYHPEPKLTGNFAPVFHIHEYKRDNFVDRKARLMTEAEFETYKKYFKGVKL